MIRFALLSIIGISSIEAATREYVDSLGVKHTTAKDKPKIVTWAHRAVSLSHYGLDKTQLLGTYGEWANSGSDYDPNNPEKGSSFPADPTPDEMKLLKEVVNLSPSCKNEYCTEFDLERFKQLKPDEFLIHGYRGNPWALNDDIIGNATEIMGKPPIFLEISMDGAKDCADDGYRECAGRSFIDVIEEHTELAEYLNIDLPASFDEDMATLCKSAKEFQEDMEIAHEKGVRVMPAYLSGSGTSYFADAKHDMVLRMFEELGMPIMHVGACTNKTLCPHNYFWENVPKAQYFTGCESNITESCNEETLYPVDVWLYDHRTTLSVKDPDFAIAYPDKAIIAGQMEFWPIGGRLITPFHAAKTLDIVGETISKAVRLHPATDCIKNVNVSSVSHKTNGIASGGYACYAKDFHNTAYFSRCDTSGTPTLKNVVGIALSMLSLFFLG